MRRAALGYRPARHALLRVWRQMSREVPGFTKCRLPAEYGFQFYFTLNLMCIMFFIPNAPYYILTFVPLRSCREELQTWSWGPNPEHHHGPEGPHEDQREKQARDLWANPGRVRCRQTNPRHADEANQAKCAWWNLQVVSKDQHYWWVTNQRRAKDKSSSSF